MKISSAIALCLVSVGLGSSVGGLVGCRHSADVYTVIERIGPATPTIEPVDVTLRQGVTVIHVECNNYKAGPGEDVEPCRLRVGMQVRCKHFADPVSDEAGGYDFICGADRDEKGRLLTSAKNELLTLETEQQDYLLVRAEPFVHHYEGSPCGLWNKQTCDEPEMRYIFQGKTSQITAHCQSWDDRNRCASLQAGITYHCQVSAADRFFGQTLDCIGAGTMGIDASAFRASAP